MCDGRATVVGWSYIGRRTIAPHPEAGRVCSRTNAARVAFVRVSADVSISVSFKSVDSVSETVMETAMRRNAFDLWS